MQKEWEENKEKGIPKSDSGYDFSQASELGVSFQHCQQEFDSFLKRIITGSEEEQRQCWKEFKDSVLFISDGKLKEMVELVDLNFFSKTLGSKFDKNEGSLLLFVSSICNDKEIIKEIIEIYQECNKKQPKEFIYKYTDKDGWNVLHYLGSGIIRKFTNNEEVKEEDFEAFWEVLRMDVNLSGDEDKNGDNPVHMISYRTNLANYIKKTEGVIRDQEKKTVVVFSK